MTAGRSARRGPARLSRMHRPPGLALESWQAELRRQFGREQRFRLTNIGGERVFSEFEVVNPANGGTYRVAVRGTAPGDNFCSCPDFATNALGICKHIAFTLARLERAPGGRAALARGFQADYSEVYVSYGPRREVRFRAGRTAPPALRRLAARYFDRDGRLRTEAVPGLDAFFVQAARFSHELRCYEDARGFVREIGDARRRADRLTQAFPHGIKSAALQRLLRVPLYPYQREGALFACRAGRCLLADEMGLGKTVQAIAAAEIMATHAGVARVLIVCPTSLKHQWEREIGRFVAGRSVQVVGGFRARREQQFSAPSFYKIVNYDTVAHDLDLIRNWAPDLVVLDEAQRIKNWQTRTARSVKKVSSPYAIVLTGTPLENRLEELVSIVEFVDPHRLGPTFRLLHDHQVREDDTGRVIGYRDLDRIGQTLRPILLRRRKAEVLDQLPSRLEKRFFVPMRPEQQRHHDENREAVARLVAKWRRSHFLSEADQRRLMSALQNMRMACDSTYLLDGTTDVGDKPDEIATLLGDVLEEPGVKVVVFSQWVRMLDLLARRCLKRGWEHVLFHGRVEGSRRGGLVDRFREDPRCRVFLSTDAGGVGLNLQHASVVVNADLPWNPAVVEQRIGRVHRLGQSRPVRVVHFVAPGTIEEGILSILGFKQSLFAGVLDGGAPAVSLGGSRLGRFIETVERVTRGAPAASPAEGAVSLKAVAPVAANTAVSDSSGDDPWAGLVQDGLALLHQLASALTPAAPRNLGPTGAPGLGAGLEAVHDEKTGERYLKLRMPAPEVIRDAVRAVQALLQGAPPSRA